MSNYYLFQYNSGRKKEEIPTKRQKKCPEFYLYYTTM